MANFFNTFGNDTTSHYRKQIDETKRLVSKWQKSGLLKGIKQEYDKHGMAVMLENQAMQLIESSRTGGQGAEEWSSVALPLVRRVFAEIAAKDFVSLQPMSLPSGLVFFLDFKYSTSQPGFNTDAGSSLQANTVHGITNQTGNASEGLYGSGRYTYSINDYTKTASTYTTGSVLYSDVEFNSDLSSSLASLQRITIDMTGTNFDKEGVSGFYISGSGITAYYAQFTSTLDSDRAASTTDVTFVTLGTATGDLTVKYHKQPLSYTRGDFEASGDPAWGSGDTGPDKYSPGSDVGANAIDIPEIDLSLRQIPVVAKTRKLKAVWTPEFAQDLNAYHSIDAETELTSMLSEYISMEIDLEILDMLLKNTLSTEVWSARTGQVYAGNNTWTTEDALQGSALAYNKNSWFQTLGVKMQKVSNQIHTKTMRGGANFAVCSPDVATILESIPGYAVDTDGDKSSFAMGVQKIGMINNRFTIYKNPYMTSNVMLMGFRGNQFLETGAAFCPYIPLIMTPVVYDPVNLVPRKGIMTRYAKVVTRPEFFGKVMISDLNYV